MTYLKTCDKIGNLIEDIYKTGCIDDEVNFQLLADELILQIDKKIRRRVVKALEMQEQTITTSTSRKGSDCEDDEDLGCTSYGIPSKRI